MAAFRVCYYEDVDSNFVFLRGFAFRTKVQICNLGTQTSTFRIRTPIFISFQVKKPRKRTKMSSFSIPSRPRSPSSDVSNDEFLVLDEQDGLVIVGIDFGTT